MLDYKVPQLSIIFMAVVALLGLVIPVVLLLFFRKKFKADIAPFFIGCAVFIVFALVVEGTIHMLVLNSPAGTMIQNNMWLMAVYGGLMAGIFEETGRFAAFKTVMRKKRGNDANALMYGAGHGGFEVFYLLVVGMISNLVMAVMLNAGMAGQLTAGVPDAAARQTLEATFAALGQTPPPTFLMSVVDRIAAVALHIALSVLVWFAAKERGRFWLYPLAVLLHAFVDVAAVILARSGVNLWLIEGVLYILAALCVLIARRVWKRAAAPVPPDAPDTGAEPQP